MLSPTPPRKTVLLDRTVSPPQRVDAEVIRDFPDVALPVVESLWRPARARLPVSMDHTHWDWLRKIGLTAFEYVAVVANTQVEGLAALARSPVPSMLSMGVDVTPLAVPPHVWVALRKHPEAGELLSQMAVRLIRGIDQFDRANGGGASSTTRRGAPKPIPSCGCSST